ncbi:MAG: sigma-70 family RNA polymerase sigma factor [Cyanobacteria bacterium CRU_2_1]|nr:sigma-70 family RNA polymerase sigma factor [Cyanobacteria bacterium RU_5_0]NJR60537.1 sigma-70 family RNA polymerase sigma factor [Cyanobacteria bacterium CRU_2_1]
MKTSQAFTDLVHVYLQDIGRIPLLTPEQEVLYGRQVKQARILSEVREALTVELNRPPMLDEWMQQARLSLGESCPQDVTELQQMVAHGERAKRKMIEANLRLVVSIAKRYDGRSMDLLDLIQEGTLGLQRGVEKFDPAMGYRFSTYAYWWIRQAVSRAIAKQDRTIALPIQFCDKLRKIRRAYRQLSQTLGRSPTPSELAQVLKLTPKQVNNYLKWAAHPLSLDMRVGKDQETQLGELLEDSRISPEEFVMQSSLAANLERLLQDLSPLQREVLSLRFGLEDGQVLTPEQTSRRLNLTQPQVHQLERRALVKLRHRRIEVGKLLREMDG